MNKDHKEDTRLHARVEHLEKVVLVQGETIQDLRKNVTQLSRIVREQTTLLEEQNKMVLYQQETIEHLQKEVQDVTRQWEEFKEGMTELFDLSSFAAHHTKT
jgi:uncharacterized coiled-coil protein SlyX